MTTYELSEYDVQNLLAISAKLIRKSREGADYKKLQKEGRNLLKECKLDSDFLYMIVGTALAE